MKEDEAYAIMWLSRAIGYWDGEWSYKVQTTLDGKVAVYMREKGGEHELDCDVQHMNLENAGYGCIFQGSVQEVAKWIYAEDSDWETPYAYPFPALLRKSKEIAEMFRVDGSERV